MHNHGDKYPVRPGFEPGTSRLQAPIDTNKPSGPANDRGTYPCRAQYSDQEYAALSSLNLPLKSSQATNCYRNSWFAVGEDDNCDKLTTTAVQFILFEKFMKMFLVKCTGNYRHVSNFESCVSRAVSSH